MYARKPAEVFPPGEFLREELEARGWSQLDLADILGRPPTLVNEIIAGRRGISAETAKGLAAAFGTSPEFWMNLESAYQVWRISDDASNAVSRRARIYSLAPIKEMIRRGWLEDSANVDVLEKRVQDFFAIRSLDEKPRFGAHAARKSSADGSVTPAQMAWLFRARQLARAVHAVPYDPDKLDAVIAQLRNILDTPQEIRHVPRILSESGIRFVLVEALAGTRIDGACFWINKSPVVALTTRYDRIDNFWFVLMHELGHVRSKDGVPILDTDLEGPSTDPVRPEEERLADQFAVEQLVPQQKLANFIARVHPLYSLSKIEGFASTVRTHPGIVLGQLQHRGKIPWNSSFRRKLLVPIRQWIIGSALADGWGSAVPAQL